MLYKSFHCLSGLQQQQLSVSVPLFVCVLGLALGLAGLAPKVSAGVAWPNGLPTGKSMIQTDYIPYTVSNQQPYFATLQNDGNFCVYAGIYATPRQPSVWCALSTSAGVDNYFLMLQNDSNLCVYHGTPAAPGANVWCSGFLIPLSTNNILTLGQCGVLNAASNNSLTYWQTPPDTNGCVRLGVAWNTLLTGQFMRQNDYIPYTASNQQPYYAIMQNDGNFCVYAGIYPTPRQPSVWCVLGTSAGIDNYFLILQADGNLCVYHGVGPIFQGANVWCSGKLNTGTSSLTLGQCGVLTAQSATGNYVYWQTPPDTNGCAL